MWWQRTVAQTASITLHPLSTSEDTTYIANTILKCKSAVQCILFHCCLVKLKIKMQNQVALLQMCFVTKWKDSAAKKRPRVQKMEYLADVFYLVLMINSLGTNKIRSKQSPFFSSLSFPNLGCQKMRRKAFCHLLLWWLWCLCYSASELRICCAEHSANSSPADLRSLDYSKQRYTS